MPTVSEPLKPSRSPWRRWGREALFVCLGGRTRPYYQAVVPDGFSGPHWWKGGDMQSYPSGHAGSSPVTGTTLFCASPILAVPGAAYAMAVSWSRMQLDRHHPLDVAVGATV